MLHYSPIWDTGVSILAAGGRARLPLYSVPGFSQLRKGGSVLERVLRVENTPALPFGGEVSPAPRCSLVFFLPLPELRLHHPNLSSVARFFPFQTPALLNANSCSLNKPGWSWYVSPKKGEDTPG